MQSADVQIFDAQGRVVANTLVTSTTQNIDITAFERGIYTVRVVCGEKVYVQKVVVE
ncbi:MAG: T9SS type A sorting domain-containing protein [bacterium]